MDIVRISGCLKSPGVSNRQVSPDECKMHKCINQRFSTSLFSSHLSFLEKMAFGEHGTETLVTESAERPCLVCLNDVSRYPEGAVTITRCCGQLLCVDCKNKCLRSMPAGSGCPHCRSTIDRITVLVNIRTFHQATLVLNGNRLTFDIPERSRRLFNRSCAKMYQEEDLSYDEAFRNTCVSAKDIIKQQVEEEVRTFAKRIKNPYITYTFNSDTNED